MNLRANAVEIVRLTQARCRLAGCDWQGPLHSTYQEANGDRQEHLAWHEMNDQHEPS